MAVSRIQSDAATASEIGIKSCYSHTKGGIDVWDQICVAYNKISYTGFLIFFLDIPIIIL